MTKRKYNDHHSRVLFIACCFAVLLSVIGIRSIYLQCFDQKNLSERATAQYCRSWKRIGKRGTIYDARHHEMAVSIDVISIAASPKQIENPRETAARLSSILDMDRTRLSPKLSMDKSFVWIKRHITPKEVEAVKALHLKGLIFEPEHKRFYPNKNLAAHIIGFSGLDGKGLEGLEYYYNKELEGTATTCRVLKDALGRGFESETPSDIQASGNNLILTVDRNIQFITEDALQKAAIAHQSRAGIAIVMDPATGAILAMADYPHFNPNSFASYQRQQWRNRAITDSFEPGSTMKVFLAAAAIEGKFCTPHSIFFCENGAYRIGGNTVHDTHPHAWLSLQQIVKFSSNIGAAKISEVSGKKILYHTLKNFGFGTKTGIDCPGETSGRLRPYQNWTPIDTANISFGQGISASPLQLVTAASAIANGGYLMRPYMVKAITNTNGNIIHETGPEKIRRVISAETAETLRRIMHTVVTEGGTGTQAYIDSYAVCGKTGTAQKLDENGCYSKRDFTASFVGFAPMEKPEIAVLVLLDEPRKQYYGGTVAAPAFKKIVCETLSYLHALSTPDELRLLVKNGKEGIGG
jgi:cell division protein FtsI (penicillin-binding protein 3)